jgi:signal peptidase II
MDNPPPAAPDAQVASQTGANPDRCDLRRKYLRLTWISGLVVLLDQATKALVLERLSLYQSVPVISGFFSLTHIHNPGGAFGFLAGHSPGLRTAVFVVASCLAIAMIVYFYHRTPGRFTALSIGFAFILGGAVGNLIDRVRLGKVVDFLDFYIGDLHWPAFNVADSAITVGIAVFVFHLLFRDLPE